MINSTKDIELINSFLKYFNTEIKEINEFSNYYIYNDDNNIIGFLDFSFIYDRIELNYIYVLKKYRGKEIASKMMKELIKFAKDNNCLNITLEVNENNISAIKLYEKYDFKNATIRNNYYGNENAILMIREMV